VRKRETSSLRGEKRDGAKKKSYPSLHNLLKKEEALGELTSSQRGEGYLIKKRRGFHREKTQN